MSALGAARFSSLLACIDLDKSWQCVIPMNTKHFMKKAVDNRSVLHPNYKCDTECSVNIMDFFNKENKIVMDSFRKSMNYPINALFEFPFGPELSEDNVISLIKDISQKNGTCLLHYIRKSGPR